MSPTCFVSYAWESDSHKGWVRELATNLQENGVLTRLDQWDLAPGLDMLRYMESAVRESDRVVLICTPTFAEKANRGVGGVGYEKSIVSAELFYSTDDTAKFVPILRNGTPKTALPSYIRSRIFVDFRDDVRFRTALQELLGALHEVQLHRRPPLGPPPTTPGAKGVVAKPIFANPSQEEFESVFRYASDPYGLGLTKREAAAWTDSFLREHGFAKFEMFRNVCEFAYSLSRLNYPTRQAAASFGFTWLQGYSHCSFDEFKRRFFFAYESSGMNLPISEALEWALSKLR